MRTLALLVGTSQSFAHARNAPAVSFGADRLAGVPDQAQAGAIGDRHQVLDRGWLAENVDRYPAWVIEGRENGTCILFDEPLGTAVQSVMGAPVIVLSKLRRFLRLSETRQSPECQVGFTHPTYVKASSGLPDLPLPFVCPLVWGFGWVEASRGTE